MIDAALGAIEEEGVGTTELEGRLRLDVADDGAGLASGHERVIRNGHGLGNVRRRLEIPPRHS